MVEQQERFYLEFFNNPKEKSVEGFGKVFYDLFSTKSTLDSFDLMMFMESNNKKLFQRIYDNADDFNEEFMKIINSCNFSCSNSILEFKLIFGDKFKPTHIPKEKLYSKSFFNGSWESSKMKLTHVEKKLYFGGISIIDITSQEMFDKLYDDELVREITFWLIESEFPKLEKEAFTSFKHGELIVLDKYFQIRHLSGLINPMVNGGFEDISHLCKLLITTIPKTKEWEDVQKLIMQEPKDLV